MRKKKLLAGILSLAMVIGMVPTAQVSAAKKISLSATKLTVEKGKTKTLKVKGTTKKVKWNVLSGKKYITLKVKNKTAVMIKGKKKGTAKIEAQIGKKKLTCKVTVKNPVAKEPAVTKEPVSTATPAPTNTPEVTATVEPTAKPTETAFDDPQSGDQKAALKNLIAELRGRGATVSEDITDTNEYTWDEDGEHLIKINWDSLYSNGEVISRNISGDISLAAFPDLNFFFCGYNQITSLDVSQNANLSQLNCNNNQLTSLNVNSYLKNLYCNDNQLTSLDVSQNANLWTLNCANNQLTSLDVSHDANLFIELNCANNQLTSLDVSQNAMLSKLNCANNQLTSLDVSQNANLSELNCANNQLTSLDLSYVHLSKLNCANNQLMSLDVSQSAWLRELNCANNQLTSLDLSNNIHLGDIRCDSKVTVTGCDECFIDRVSDDN